MDAGSNEYYLAVVFEDRESYRANAESPDQQARNPWRVLGPAIAVTVTFAFVVQSLG